MEGENALGYLYNLSTWHQISTCWLCLCALSLSRQLPLHSYICVESAHWGQSDNGLCFCSSPGPGLSPSTLAHMPLSLCFGGSIHMFPRGRALKRVSTFFQIHPGLRSMETCNSQYYKLNSLNARYPLGMDGPTDSCGCGDCIRGTQTDYECLRTQ